MRTLLRAAMTGGLLATASPALALTDGDFAEVERAIDAPRTAASSNLEEELARGARLAAIIDIALSRSPELGEAGARARAGLERARAAGRLPDPELRYQLWNAPLAMPLSPEMHMLGVAQSFPAPGSRQARSESELGEARMTLEGRRAREQDLVTQVRRAFYDYQRADRELAIRREHLTLAQRIVELARANYQAGRASQQDVLRAGVEISRLQADLIGVEQARRSAAVMLNALMAREPDAPLGPAVPVAAPDSLPETERLAAAVASRPEIAEAQQAIRRSESSLDAARREARLPGFSVGVDYMFSPAAEGGHGESGSRHGYSLMASMSLPWLNPGRKDQVREAEASLAADRRARDAALIAARSQLGDALARVKAARETFALIERELLPQARQSYEAAEAGFAAGQSDSLGLLDAERSYLQVRIDRERALAQFLASVADLERAAGIAGPASESHAEER